MKKFIHNQVYQNRLVQLVLFIGLMMPGSLLAQCNLSCNNGINTSLDPNCTAIITTDIILEGGTNGCVGPFVIELYDENGNYIPSSPMVDGTYIDQTLTVIAIAQGSNNSCEGSVTIEDKTKPVITCTNLSIPCNASTHPDNIGYPAVVESCDPNPTLNYTDQTNLFSCNPNFVGEIVRTWTAVDASGNEAIPCQQIISLQRPVLADIEWPLNKDDIQSPSIDCSTPDISPSVAGVPTLNGQDITNNGPCNLWIGHSDLPATPLCDGSFAIYRTWTVTEEWCGTSSGTSSTQIIKVMDKTGPTLTCQPDFTINADNASCTGTFTVPAATATDDCSADANISITVSGDSGPLTPGQTLTVPIGMYSMTYTATDDCGNTSTCSTTVFMDDGVPPVVICISSTTVGLTNTDTTLVNAVIFDDGSYDNCGPITYLARRMDNPNCPGDDATDFDTTVPFTCCDVGSSIMVEFSVTDAINQLTNICMIEVVVQDNLPMQLECPDDISINCDQDYTDLNLTGEATGSDNCGIQSLVYTDSLDLDPCNIGKIFRTWTATDSYGQTTSCTQIITTVSTGPGVVTYPPNIWDAECGDADDTDITGEPTFSGNCNMYGAGSSDVVFFLEDSCVRKVIRTWYVLDWCSGVLETDVQIIKETDNDPPVIDGVPADMNVSCDNVPPPANPTATDNCTAPSLTFDETTEVVGCNSIITRTWTAEDQCGNTAVATQTLNVVDSEAPVFSNPPGDENVECDALPAVPQVTATDNCSDPIVVPDSMVIAGSCTGEYMIVRTWTATDDCGNSTEIQQTINVSDTTAPTISNVPADVDAACDMIPPVGNVMVTDNCDDSVQLNFNETQTPGACNGEISIIRTWTATDDCGNESTAQQVINLSDNTAPVFSNVPANVAVECDNIPTPVDPSVADNCDPNPTVTFETFTEALSCEDEYILRYVWTATDDCGNVSSAEQVINVSDNTAPLITGVPADVSVECDNVPAPASPTTSDNCDTDPTFEFAENLIPGACTDNYTLVRTWTATDNCDNVTTESQTIDVSDTTPPVLTGVPADVTVECDEVPALPNVTATDNCDPTLVVIFEETSDPQNGCAGTFGLVRSWTATDNCGNVTTQSQTITLTDTTAPEIDGVPADLNLSCSQPIPPAANPTASDECDNDVDLVFEEITTPGACVDEFVIARTWTATDFCGNETVQTQTITVEDTSAPFLTGVPMSVTVDCDAIPEVAEPTAIDDCDTDVTIEFTETTNTGGCTAEFTITRTWTATDNCGNATTGTQVITTVDNDPPVFSATPVNMTVECDEVPVDPGLTATDNCDTDVPVILVETQIPGICENEFTLVRTWTATDDCGNSSVHTQTITVEDMTTPFMPPISPLLFVNCDEIPVAVDPVPTDNCDPNPQLIFTEENNFDNCVNGTYTIIRTWTAVDACGNDLVQVQTINVIDNNNPVLSPIPADVTVECDAVPDPPTVTATDICDMDVEVEFMESITPGACTQNYTITWTWTAIDNCGNMDVGTQVITVVDTTAPTIDNAPANLSVECDQIPPPATVTATDNCDIDVDITFVENTTPGLCLNQFTLTRTWTATDDCGNSTVTTQTIEVDDTQAPVLIGVPNNATVECDMVPSAANVIANDNCDTDIPVVFAETQTPGMCANAYTLTRTWTAEDDCGNATTSTQIINVEDTTPPQINCVVDTTFRLTGNSFTCELLDFLPVNAFDNCTDGSDLVIEWEMDFGGDGIVDTVGSFNNPSTLALVYPIGVNVGTFTTTDECGNVASCESVVVVIDNIGPGFFIDPQSVTLNFQTGLAQTAAVDYVDEPFFECCPDTILFLLPDGTFTDSITWDCDDTAFLPMGVPTTVRFYDCYGNYTDVGTFTPVNPPIEDPNFCGTIPPMASVISGMITTESMAPIETANVNLSGGMEMLEETSNWGAYQFYGVPVGYNYQVAPELDVFPTNGVSTYDIVLILKHILEIQTLDSPYKLIAADVDRSGHISTFDVVELKKLILGIDSTFSNNTSWRFVDAGYVFPDPQDPFLVTFPEMYSINDLYAGVNDIDFIGVKTGDVNQTATGNFTGSGEVRTGELHLVADDQVTRNGETLEVTFTAKDFKNIAGFQFTINFDNETLEFKAIHTGDLLNLSVDNFGTSLLDKGWITSSWFDIAGQSLDDDAVLFSIEFEAKATTTLSRLISISSDYTRSEAYIGSTTKKVDLHFGELDLTEQQTSNISLYQNRPNPFKEQTTISFYMPQGEAVVIEVFDASGRSCLLHQQFYAAGYQELEIQAADLPATGIYYYELRTSSETIRNKMVAIW